MDENTIIKIINKFAEDGIVFSNEQDFQFEIALALKNEPDVAEVKLEVISLNDNWKTVEEKAIEHEKLSRGIKEYYDILVVLNNGQKCLIELKYKTPNKICFYETKKGKMVTFVQGAYDEGAYSYIQDICRLEQVNKRNLLNDFTIDCGYAVLLTNDKNYRYNSFSRVRSGKQSPWKNYSIREGNTLKGKLLFAGKENPEEYVTSKKMYTALFLKEARGYIMNWNSYNLDRYNGIKCVGKYDDFEDKNNVYNPGFSFLVNKVNPQ